MTAATAPTRRFTPPRPRVERVTGTIRQIDDRFADNLYALRRSKAVTRDALAARTGIAPRTIERIERGHPSSGRRPVSIGEALVLADALGVPVTALLRAPVQDAACGDAQ